jgi:hypothetical protein
MESDMSYVSETPGAAPVGALTDEEPDRLFRTARTYSYWLEKPAGDDTLRRLYELMKRTEETS